MNVLINVHAKDDLGVDVGPFYPKDTSPAFTTLDFRGDTKVQFFINEPDFARTAEKLERAAAVLRRYVADAAAAVEDAA